MTFKSTSTTKSSPTNFSVFRRSVLEVVGGDLQQTIAIELKPLPSKRAIKQTPSRHKRAWSNLVATLAFVPTTKWLPLVAPTTSNGMWRLVVSDWSWKQSELVSDWSKLVQSLKPFVFLPLDTLLIFRLALIHPQNWIGGRQFTNNRLSLTEKQKGNFIYKYIYKLKLYSTDFLLSHYSTTSAQRVELIFFKTT